MIFTLKYIVTMFRRAIMTLVLNYHAQFLYRLLISVGLTQALPNEQETTK